MIIAATDSFGYHLITLLHILAVIIAFGASFALPVLGTKLQKLEGSAKAEAYAMTYDTARILIAPFIVAAGALGILLVGLAGDDAPGIAFDQGWVSASMTVWIVISAVAWFLLTPTERRSVELTRQLADGTDDGASAELEGLAKKSAAYGGIVHLGFLALMVLMIWKPGS